MHIFCGCPMRLRSDALPLRCSALAWGAHIMFGFGKNKPILDEDVETFHIRTWEWLLDCGGGPKFVRDRKLVLPNAAFFPATDLEGHARAEHILRACQTHAGLSDRPVKLIGQAELAGRVSTFLNVQNPAHAAGTFSHSGNAGRITYDVGLLKRPVSLIATFAHELGHYFNDGFRHGHPDGEDAIEPATDTTASFLGFGVFGANSAFEFQRFQDYDSQGWSSSRLGYIGEDEWAFDLAMFSALGSHDLEPAREFLKPHIWKQANRALKQIEESGIARRILGG